MLRSSQDVRGINRSEYFDTQPRKESMSLPDKLLLTPIDKFERHSTVLSRNRSVSLEDGHSHPTGLLHYGTRPSRDH